MSAERAWETGPFSIGLSATCMKRRGAPALLAGNHARPRTRIKWRLKTVSKITTEQHQELRRLEAMRERAADNYLALRDSKGDGWLVDCSLYAVLAYDQCIEEAYAELQRRSAAVEDYRAQFV